MGKTYLLTNIAELVTMAPAAYKQGRGTSENDLGVIKNAAVLVRDGRVLWTGPEKKLSKKILSELKIKSAKRVSCEQQALLPAFVESHTHLVFAGDRTDEFELRNQGVGYKEIAARGGGIAKTMRATRDCPAKVLQQMAQQRLDRLIAQGVAAVEIKSGYGPDGESEMKILKVAASLKGARVVRTFLGPHTVPKEFHSADVYLAYLENEVLPQVAKKKLAERVDIYIEPGFFTAQQGRRWFAKAQKYGLKIVAHVEQLSHSGGLQEALLANCQSVDHVVHLNETDITTLAKSQSTAVLLPTSDFYLRVAYPPARQLIDKGVRVALATDFNPGTSPTLDLSLVGVLARLEMKMTLPEVLAAYTLGGAYALGLADEFGSIEVGKQAKFAKVIGSWRELFYQVGHHPVQPLIF